MSTPASENRNGRRGNTLYGVVGIVAGIVLGFVLLLSSYAKAVDPVGFATQIVRDGFLGEPLATPAALLVIAIEAAVGIALCINFRRPLVLWIATLMMLGFLGLAVWQWIVPPEDAGSCGCFGNLVQQTPGQKALSNGGFFLLALLAWSGTKLSFRRGLLAWIPLAGFVGALGFTLAAPRLPIDDWRGATNLRVGEAVADLRIDEVIPELQEERSLVLLIDLSDEQTRIDISRVNEHLVLAGASVSVFALAEANEQLEAEFFWTAGPAFDVRTAPYGLIKPLYRALPRTFLVEDGKISRVWNEIPDDATLQAIGMESAP